jgi:hypothetical protein
MKKFKIVPSKGGKVPSHCSSMVRLTEKIDRLSNLFVSLEKCTINLHRFLNAVWNLGKFLWVKAWRIIVLLSILSAL